MYPGLQSKYLIMSKVDNNIDHLQPEMARRVKQWLNACKAEKLNVFLVETLRSYQRSDELYAQGRTLPGKKVTNAKAGQSYHNFGLSVDCVPKDKNGNPTWDFDPFGPMWKRVVELAQINGLAWGGFWKTFKDYPHFQLIEVPQLTICRKKWPGGYIPK